MNLRNLILEVLDTSVSDYEIKVHPYSKNVSVIFAVGKERYELNFSRGVEIDNLITIDFQRWAGEERGYNMSSPDGGDYNPAQILGSIINLIKMVLGKFPDIRYLTFNTNDADGSRVRLYDAIVKRFIGEGVVRQVDRNSPVYRSVVDNYPKAWVLEVVRR